MVIKCTDLMEGNAALPSAIINVKRVAYAPPRE
jgi:hypothetical protein